MNVKEFWKKNALNNIRPNRGKSDFVEGAKALEALCVMVGDEIVTEFGCGRGRLAQLFDDEKYYGIDISERAIEEARKTNPAHRFDVITDEYALKNVDSDVVFAHTVLLHIPDEDIDDTIKMICDATDRVVISEIMDPRLRQSERMPPALNRSADQYVALFDQCGFVLAEKQDAPYEAYDGKSLTILAFEYDRQVGEYED